MQILNHFESLFSGDMVLFWARVYRLPDFAGRTTFFGQLRADDLEAQILHIYKYYIFINLSKMFLQISF